MTRHRTRNRLIVGLVVALLATAVSTAIWARAGARPDQCTRLADRAQQRAQLVTGRGREVLVIGDSYSVGAGLPLRWSWPVRLPGRVRVDGFAGSGFSVGASGCGDVSYATRANSVRRRTKLVVVEGGLNDTDQPLADVRAGFKRLVTALRREGVGSDRIVVVGPPLAPARRRDRVRAVDAALARLSKTHRVRYVSMLRADLSYLDDDLHPDTAGHRAFGDRVAQHLAAR